jgi:hypothetical protein
MSVKVKSPLRFSKPFTDPWTQPLDSCPAEPEPPAPPSSESLAPRPGVQQDAALNVRPQLNSSSIRRRQRSESPESPGKLVIDEDRFAIKRSGKFQITENLWKIKDQKSEVQRLESSGIIDQGEFIRRFEKLGHECPDPGNMPFCILDEPSNSCTFVAPTENAPKLWRDLIRAHAKTYRVPYSFDQKKEMVPRPWAELEALPDAKLAIMRDKKLTVSNRLDGRPSPETPSVIAMPLWCCDAREWIMLHQEQIPAGFFDL